MAGRRACRGGARLNFLNLFAGEARQPFSSRVKPMRSVTW
jgi:hypothetical protein